MKVTKTFAATLPVIFITGCSLGLAEIEFGIYMMPISILMAFLILPMYCIERAVDMSLHPEKYAAKKAKYEAEKAEARRKREAKEAELWQKREAMKYARSIVEVKIIGGGSTVTKTHGLGGAILGGALFGVPGAIVGSVIPKGTEQKVRFAVRYGDGRVEVKECHPNSWEYKELIKHVKWEDLK